LEILFRWEKRAFWIVREGLRFRKTFESLKIGKKVLVINAGDHLKVIPLPSDPFSVLHGAFNVKKSFKELREQAELAAEKEVKK